MARRKKKKNASKVIAYAFAVIFILVLIVFGLNYTKKLKPALVNTWSLIVQTGSTQPEVRVYANSTISWQGLIKEIAYNIKVSTSYKLLYSGNEFFAKSDNYLLGNYVDKTINFSGVVVGFSPDNIPVINITYIKWNQEDTGEIEESILTWKVLNKDGLVVNLENIADDLKVRDWSWSSILIYKELTGENLSGSSLTWDVKKEISYLKIVSFKCDASNSLTDCISLENKFKQFHFDTVTNDNWLTFYKLPETNQYEAFGAEYGYYFYPLTGDFYSLINAFSVVNTKQNKLDAIKNACKNWEIQLTTILDIKFSGDNYQVVWMDQNANKVLCKLTLTENNGTYVASLQSLDYLRDKKFSTTGLNENDYLIYKSRAYGFSVYMPKWIKYRSDLINKDFGISGLKCLQVVNIAHRKKWDLASPDVKVYYCKTQVSKYLVEDGLAVNYKKFKIIDGKNKMFVIIYKDNDTAKKILNYLKVF